MNKFNIEKNLILFKRYQKYVNEHDEFGKMYVSLHEYYENKDDEFINIEKVRLQTKAGKYSKDAKNFIINLACIAIAFILNGYITMIIYDTINNAKKVSLIFNVITSFYIFILLCIIIINMHDKNSIVYDVALQVIDDIQKQRQTNVMKQYEIKLLNKFEQITISPKGIEYNVKQNKKVGLFKRLFR